MIKRLFVVFFAAVLLLFATQVWASSSYDETADGDLSGDRLAPTSITLSGGSNVVAATMSPSDIDYLHVTIPTGHELSAINLDAYDQPFGQSFIGVQAGEIFTVSPSLAAEADMLGYDLFGQSDLGDSILDEIGSGFGAQGFSGALPSGEYTFWIQETATDPAYTLDFIVNVDYDESNDGDLSSNRLAPTQLSLGPGSNTIEGLVFGGTISDIDYVTLNIPDGLWLTSIVLDDYNYPAQSNNSFIAIQAGDTFTEDPNNANSENLLGATLFGDDKIGTDILDDLGSGADLGATIQGFSGALTPGAYTLWIQETGTDGSAQYDLEINLVEPTDIYLPMTNYEPPTE